MFKWFKKCPNGFKMFKWFQKVQMVSNCFTLSLANQRIHFSFIIYIWSLLTLVTLSVTFAFGLS